MPWFWRGDQGDHDHDDDEYSSSYESYTEDEEDQEDDDHDVVDDNRTPLPEEVASADNASSSCEDSAASFHDESSSATTPTVVSEHLDGLKLPNDEVCDETTPPTEITDTTNPARPQTYSDDDQDEDESQDEDEQTTADETGETNTTTRAEKESLLILAAEHDRVDILQAILHNDSNSSTSGSDDANTLGWLMNPTSEQDPHKVTTVPPLHVAVSFGSVNAVNYLLRKGADPSLRPDVSYIFQLQQQSSNKNKNVPIPGIHRFDGRSAWELAFGTEDSSSPSTPTSTSSWYLSPSSKNNNHHTILDMPPSKREGIRHAFTAEALRCIGSGDEHERLMQLLNAGMPSTIDIGGKTLAEWAIDMNATECQKALQTLNPSSSSGMAPENTDDSNTLAAKMQTHSIEGVVTRFDGDKSSIPALTNRLEELENLGRALSTCLDNLAEEVSVCAGLLLVGSGAAALATHVRSLKITKERKMEELQRHEEAWENSQDELAYWVKECGARFHGDNLIEDPTACEPIPTTQHSVTSQNTKNEDDGAAENDEVLQQQRQQLEAQIGACETKIRMLRASIADLSEENDRNLRAVEQRGLSGGINLVRGLRDEIRENEFRLAECKSAEAACRANIVLWQSKAKLKAAAVAGPEKAGDMNGLSTVEKPSVQSTIEQVEKENNSNDAPVVEYGDHQTDDNDADVSIPTSKQISSGMSTAIVVRQENGSRGYLPMTIWEILLRIMGFGSNGNNTSAPRSGSGSSHSIPAMIV